MVPKGFSAKNALMPKRNNIKHNDTKRRPKRGAVPSLYLKIRDMVIVLRFLTLGSPLLLPEMSNTSGSISIEKSRKNYK